ncbi:MAG: patatin-like phospholipase family protein, partial [Pseudomonadota bacterium]
MSIGLTLGSGGARGWAHVGVLRALDELGVRPDVVAGASIGAVVGGAYLIDQMPAFEAWARAFSPLSALRSFRLDWGKGGVVETSRAFDAFRESDRRIEDLDRAFGVVAADLATGEQVWISRGSVLDAA